MPVGGGLGQERFAKHAAECGYLVFEGKGDEGEYIPADVFALAVNRANVPLVVLNACRSGMLGQGKTEAAVATRLLEGGVASVVAMGYIVYAVAAAEFMAAFYEALFAGSTISAAVTTGRRQLFRNKERPSPKGMLPLEDWIVPVHYTRRAIAFPMLQQKRKPETLSLDAMLDRMRSRASVDVDSSGVSSEALLAPVGRFVGRDAEFYKLELALQWQRVVLLHGPGGTGKTELAKAFGRWWRQTGGVETPEYVFFHSFEPGLASFGLDAVMTEIGQRLFGSEFSLRTRDASERKQVIRKLLHERRMLLIWDNFESVYTLPDSNGAASPLDEAERRCIRDFLGALRREGGRSGLILTSRTPESWLGDVRRIEVGGLTRQEAAEMSEDVLRPYPRARERRKERAFAELMEWLNGHPLSLRLLLPRLEETTPGTMLEALKGNAESLPSEFLDAGEGRSASLRASVKYSFDHLTEEVRERLPALALFEGVVDVGILTLFSEAKEVPTRFTEVTLERWSEILQQLAGIGLLTMLSRSMYSLHPALPAYLTAEWHRITGTAFDEERAMAESALLTAYTAFGDLAREQIESGNAEKAFVLIDQQRRTMRRLLRFALTQERYADAQKLIQPLNVFWDTRGLWEEGLAWIDRCRQGARFKFRGNSPNAELGVGTKAA